DGESSTACAPQISVSMRHSHAARPTGPHSWCTPPRTGMGRPRSVQEGAVRVAASEYVTLRTRAPRAFPTESAMSKKKTRDDPIGDYVEWTEHRYDPGHYTGGRLSPATRSLQRLFSSRDKRVLLAVIIAAVIVVSALRIRQWLF